MRFCCYLSLSGFVLVYNSLHHGLFDGPHCLAESLISVEHFYGNDSTEDENYDICLVHKLHASLPHPKRSMYETVCSYRHTHVAAVNQVCSICAVVPMPGQWPNCGLRIG